MTQKRIFLVDGDPVFLAGLRVTIDDDAALDVAGEATTGTEAVSALRQLPQPADLVLMNVGVVDRADTESMRVITSRAEFGPTTPRLLVVSSTEDDDAVIAALRAGARGYLVKGGSREELLHSIHIVADGAAVFSPSVAAKLGAYFSAIHDLPSRTAFPALTDREREVLDLIARGYDNRRIARELVLSHKTVSNHISHVFAKLQVTDRTTAAMRARDAGLGT
nr:response regulator transcription factor [Kibdelosporangium sp. MJ126-NF4]CEL12829.1 regulatory protein, LuxR:Response regulator receiver [Kibdelosporangium sp. MJ126-NF4]CTQ98515.1 regulatory protein, LuxR:Response regulator receiver [Kibdelosporangium sp. MJ126-NF4]